MSLWVSGLKTMNVADHVVQYLMNNGTTDAYGIPGGVVLELLYAMDRADGFTPHLSYHEQGAAFAASGYAQVSGKLGVVYCTRGPGVTNLMTVIADAYYESIPVLILTAHATCVVRSPMRMMEDQEMDTPALFGGICKYAASVEKRDEVDKKLRNAVATALSGRRGPVLLDFSTRLLSELWDFSEEPAAESVKTSKSACGASEIAEAVGVASRPVFLIGEGVRQAEKKLVTVAERMGIPVISSRAAQDVMPKSRLYFGYIGSHGIRYANFILSKADLVIALGNRMSFPMNSESFTPIFQKAKTIRVEIDAEELNRNIPNSTNLCMDAAGVLEEMESMPFLPEVSRKWLDICMDLKTELYSYDVTEPVRRIVGILQGLPQDCVIVGDVGNHELWLSRAYTFSGIGNRILYSKSFGTLGCALPKALGVCCATGTPVACFAGDQGIQLNIQELQSLAQEALPVTVYLINNHTSGMIRSRQQSRPYFLHTTTQSGYGTPDFRLLAEAYHLPYCQEGLVDVDVSALHRMPVLIELDVDEDCGIQPSLPKGSPCQKLSPPLPETVYNQLEQL